MFDKKKWRKFVKQHNENKIDFLEERAYIADIIKKSNGQPIRVVLTGFCCDTGFYTIFSEMIFENVMDFIRQRDHSRVSSDGPGDLYIYHEN